MKRGLSVYLDPAVMDQLTTFAKRQRQSKSLIAETAIVSFLTPDDADRREAAVERRLDQLSRQIERLERDLTVSVEALTLYIVGQNDTAQVRQCCAISTVLANICVK
jgi:hypothetical protein